MLPQDGTAVIRAYETLSRALRVVLEPIGVQVLDGPRVAQDLDDDVLLIGYSGDAAMTLTHQRAQGLGNRIDETVEVRCLFSTVSGDTDLVPRRARVQEFIDVVSAMTALEQPLAGMVDRLAWGTTIDFQQEQTSDGCVCELSFSITGRIIA